MRISKLIFMKVGGQQTQFARPFHSRVDQQIQNEFSNIVTSNPINIASGLMEISDKIVFPNPQHAGAVVIPGDWQNHKLIFFMEIEDQADYAGSVRTQVITGFTDKADYTLQGRIAPDTKLYFNNSVSILESTIWTPNGQTKSRRMETASHILHAQSTPGIHGPSALSMRPMDVFGVLSSDALSQSSMVIDCAPMFHNGMQMANRRDEFSPTYLERALSSYEAAKSKSHGSDSSLFYDAKNYSKQLTSKLSNFILKLKANSSLTYSDYVTYEELCMAFDADKIGVLVTPSNEAVRMGSTSTYTAANTCGWNGANFETIDANYLIHSLPSLMMDMLIQDISFVSTNDTLSGDIKTIIQGVNGFSSKIDLSKYIQGFISRFEFEHMRRLTMNGGRSVKLKVNMNLLGESYLNIQYDQNHPYEFLAPSFCDGFFSPLITKNQQDLREMAQTFETLLSNIGTEIKDTPANFIQPFQHQQYQPPADRGMMNTAPQQGSFIIDSRSSSI